MVLRLLEGQRRRALGDAVDVLGVGERDVEGERGGSVRARVGVRVERFAPGFALGGAVSLVLELEERSTVEHRRLVAPDADGDAERRVRHDDVHVGVFGEKHRARPRGTALAPRLMSELNVGKLGRRQVVDEDVRNDEPRMRGLVHAEPHDALVAVGRELDPKRAGLAGFGEDGAPSPAASADRLPPPLDRVDLARGALRSIA
mmetsp:Transcript_2703/g.10581  ORF Transcript_2703/g.10581 Transcript_2703/m.10581 type:complete len:203 (+) Transcript_2703:2255-2863(+)